MDVASLSIKIDSTDVKSATRAMDGATSSGINLESIIKKVAVGWGLMKVADYARDVATLAARYETLGAVMGVVGNNAGYTRAQMAGFEVELTKTGISMIGARDALTMMAGAQMDLTKSSQMARIAQDAAVIGNINSSEAFQRMVQGIRSGETEILRTIGISVNFEQAYQKIGQTLGKTSKDLTDLEKLMARQNVVMEYGSKIAGAYEASMGTAGKQLLSMQRYAEDLQVVFGGIFSDAFGVVVQTLNSALADTKKWLEQNAEAASLVRENLGLAAKNFVDLVREAGAIGSSTSEIKENFTWMEIASAHVAGFMALIKDAFMTVVGLGQKFSANMLAIPQAVGEAVRWVMGLFSIQPPQWLQRVIGLRDEQIAKANKNMMGGAISQFMNGTTFDPAAFDRENNATMEAAKAEQNRIKAANQTRQEAEALTRKNQAMESAAKAASAYQKQLSQLNLEIDKERILMEGGANALYRFELAQRGIHEADIASLVAKRASNEMTRTMIDLDKRLLEGKLKLVEVNPDIQKSLFGGYQRAQDMGDPGRMERDYLRQDSADMERWKDTMPLEPDLSASAI